MTEKDFYQIIASELQLKGFQVANTVELLDAGNTVPFIARYRKEATGKLDEEQIREIEERIKYLRMLEERILNFLFQFRCQFPLLGNGLQDGLFSLFQHS